jgi:hypothetical protein
VANPLIIKNKQKVAFKTFVQKTPKNPTTNLINKVLQIKDFFQLHYIIFLRKTLFGGKLIKSNYKGPKSSSTRQTLQN